MKRTAYGKPLLINSDNEITSIVKVQEFNELTIQNLIFDHPECLPISDIDEAYNPVIPVCMELNTTVGPLDIFMISPNGELTIVETKLWRNPESRRKVVAQILDYAQVMSNWSYSDLQREVNRKTGRKGNTLYNIAKDYDPEKALDEPDFVDAVERNLRRGNFLLLIVGDGIREGARGIAEFLTKAGHLNFTFGMVELGLYRAKHIGTLVIPRVLVKTTEISRYRVEIPKELSLVMDNDKIPKTENNQSRPDTAHQKARSSNFYTIFWNELIAELNLDDPSQPLPNSSNSTNIFLYPANTKKAWISAYFSKTAEQVGVYFRTSQTEGKHIADYLLEQKEEIEKELGPLVNCEWNNGANVYVNKDFPDVHDEAYRHEIKEFFKEELNRFVNLFRPRLKNIESN